MKVWIIIEVDGEEAKEGVYNWKRIIKVVNTKQKADKEIRGHPYSHQPFDVQ